MSCSERSLNTHQLKALAALLEGQPVEDAAQLAGVSSRQVYRYLQDERFAARLTQEQAALISAVGVRLVVLGEKALSSLEAVLEHPGMKGANILRLAAVSILDLLLKYREQVDLELRVSKLEEQVRKEGEA